MLIKKILDNPEREAIDVQSEEESKLKNAMKAALREFKEVKRQLDRELEKEELRGLLLNDNWVRDIYNYEVEFKRICLEIRGGQGQRKFPASLHCWYHLIKLDKVTGPYRSIQDAIDAAEPNSLIKVSEGFY